MTRVRPGSLSHDCPPQGWLAAPTGASTSLTKLWFVFLPLVFYESWYQKALPRRCLKQ